MSLCLNLIARFAVNRKVGGLIKPSEDIAQWDRFNLHFTLSDINYLESVVIIVFFRQNSIVF